jgi:hypothetical protein
MTVSDITQIKEGQILNSYFYRRIIKHNKNVLNTITGATGCLSENTIVAGQSKTLGQLYKSGNKLIKTISLAKHKNSSGCYHPKISQSEIIDSGIKDIYEIELEDGKKIYATDEHKLFKVNNNKITEIEVKNLKVGNNLRFYNFKKYYNEAKEKEDKKRIKNYTPKIICKRCGMLFYKENKRSLKKLCKTCKELSTRKIYRDDNWFEWEKNILRLLYQETSKEKLLELLPNRSWKAIRKKSKKLHIKRNKRFQTEKTQWTSKNNPMNNLETREKTRQKLKGKVPWNKNKKQWLNKEHPRGMLGKKHSTITTDKISKSLSGENGPNWQGGLSYEPYNKDFNKLFKKYIRNRDNNECCLCKNKTHLLIHHIDYNKVNTIEKNCITVCFKCHGKMNYNRKSWQDTLNKILENKYEMLKS